jgi:hypothetical protein
LPFSRLLSAQMRAGRDVTGPCAVGGGKMDCFLKGLITGGK